MTKELEKKERMSNFELMRIFSMIMIIIWHIIMHSNIRENTVGVNNLLVNFLYIFCAIHVNSFIILTGYFSFKKDKINWKKIWNIFSAAWFYKVVFVITFVFLGLEHINKVDFVKELLPLSKTADYWFINFYIVICLFSPYLNILIRNMNQIKHKKFLILLFFIYSIIPVLSKNTTIQNNGFTISNFVLMYFIGSYLAKYPIVENVYFKNLPHRKKQLLFFFLFLSFGLLNILMYTFSLVLLNYDNMFVRELESYISFFRATYSNPLIIFQTIFYVLFFSTLSIKSKTINFISSLTLGVYLIHENHHIYQFIYQFIGFDSLQNMQSSLLVFRILLLSVAIFFICIMVEFLRRKIFSFVANRKITKKACYKVHNFVTSTECKY